MAANRRDFPFFAEMIVIFFAEKAADKNFLKNMKKTLAFFLKMVYYIIVAPRGMLI